MQIKKVDRQPRTKIESLLLSEGQAYAQLYLRLLKKLQRVDTQQCILIWIADALSGALFAFSQSSVSLMQQRQITKSEFLSSPESRMLSYHTAHCYGAFYSYPQRSIWLYMYCNRMLDSQDDFVQLKATQILTVLLRSVQSCYMDLFLNMSYATLALNLLPYNHNTFFLSLTPCPPSSLIPFLTNAILLCSA